MTPADVDPLRIAARVCAVLESIGSLYSVGGSVASSFSGEPRSTLDIDIVVSLEASHIAPLIAALENEFYIERVALERAIRGRSTANLIHRETSVKIDLYLKDGATRLGVDDLLTRRFGKANDLSTTTTHVSRRPMNRRPRESRSHDRAW